MSWNETIQKMFEEEKRNQQPAKKNCGSCRWFEFAFDDEDSKNNDVLTRYGNCNFPKERYPLCISHEKSLSLCERCTVSEFWENCPTYES